MACAGQVLEKANFNASYLNLVGRALLAKPDAIPPTLVTPLLPNVVGPPAPEHLPAPGAKTDFHVEGKHPFQPTIIDFHWHDVEYGGLPAYGRFDIDEVIGTPGPTALMKKEKWRLKKPSAEAQPHLRWIHIPFNSMLYAEEIITKICEEYGLDTEAAEKTQHAILRADRWRDRFHRKQKKDAYHARYMQTFCSEITVDEELLGRCPQKTRDQFCHAGANLVLFMPFLHWGTLHVLDWRVNKIKTVEERLDQRQNGKLEMDLTPLVDEDDSKMLKYYTNMMDNQLISDTPLHLRRTLDQFYYTHMKDTNKRDFDQIVTKYGVGGQYWSSLDDHEVQTEETFEDKKKRLASGKHTILMVDQLWLWIIGSNTVVTCFDRRWEKDTNPQTNVFDNVLWKLRRGGQGKNIKSAYDLANIIIDEASSFFFDSADDEDDSPHFHELFQKAICKVSERQTCRFAELESVSCKGKAMDLSRAEQNLLFDLSKEFALVSEVRDIIDELTMIQHIYREQLSILQALWTAQYHQALYHWGYRQETPETPNGSNGDAPPNDPAVLAERLKKAEYIPTPEINWDSRSWFKRTRDYMEAHHNSIVYDLSEIAGVYEALQNTIALKQNSATIFEAHASRREGEAIMLFTLVSSTFLPLSFFASIFGMNVVEMNPASILTLSRAMTITIPLSLLFIGLSMMFAFKRDVRDFFIDTLAFKGQPHKHLTQWRIKDRIAGLDPGLRTRRQKTWGSNKSCKGDGCPSRALSRPGTWDPPGRRSMDVDTEDREGRDIEMV